MKNEIEKFIFGFELLKLREKDFVWCFIEGIWEHLKLLEASIFLLSIHFSQQKKKHSDELP